jgi:hypothetical protein
MVAVYNHPQADPQLPLLFQKAPDVPYVKGLKYPETIIAFGLLI